MHCLVKTWLTLFTNFLLNSDIYIFFAFTLDESVIVDAHYFLMKNIHQLCDLGCAFGLRAVEDVPKPPGSLLATDRSKAVVLV